MKKGKAVGVVYYPEPSCFNGHNGEVFFTDSDFLSCIREELPYKDATGFRYEVLAASPATRKAADDMLFDLIGEENPADLADYEKADMVYELCPNCDNEVGMSWNVAKHGYKAFCPFCGQSLMLCDECLNGEDETACSCDYDDETGLCHRCQSGEVAQ